MVDRVEFTGTVPGIYAPGQEPVEGIVDPSAPTEATSSETEGTTATTAEPTRPSWLPEKFKSEEDLAKAYTELEKKLGGNTSTESKGTKSEQQTSTEGKAKTESSELEIPGEASEAKAPEEGTEAPEGTVEKAVENAGLDLKSLSTEFHETGTLSDESFQAFEKVGITKEYVQTYIEGLKAQQELNTMKVQAEVGGPQVYTEMMQWAKQNLSPDEIKAFNTSVSSNDMEQIKFAVKGLHAQFVQQEGHEPKNIRGQSNARDVGGTFATHGDMMQAMQDKRYGRDPDYTRSVEQKAIRSNF